jgi:hypothetical protein
MSEEQKWNRSWAFLAIVVASASAWWGIILLIKEIWK